ncbi:MAG TPA: hypothetical protein VK461_16070, partial [Acidimicrobiales bacterium]|nr:hypothetical protein [Acidimicrobiales bacterium]
REHEKFYASAPRQQAVTLQTHARALCALADRWTTVTPSAATPFSTYEGAVDLNDLAALQLDGVLFMEGEGEPAEITRIKLDLRAIGEESSATGAWLATAMSASWEMATSLFDITEVADLVGDRHRIIANDWQAADMSALAGRILQRAVAILETLDFAPASLRRDLAAERLTPRLLHSASELIAHAADLLSDSAGLVHDNEPRWRRFKQRAQRVLEEAEGRE